MPKTCSSCGVTMRTSQATSLPSEGSALYCLTCLDKKLQKLPANTVVSACPRAVRQGSSRGQKYLDDVGVDFMTYKEGKKKRKPGHQLEHALPNSSFVNATGRRANPVPGASQYTEDKGLVYNIEDDQSHGTEHKDVTDGERAIDKQMEVDGVHATVEEKVTRMVPVWERMLMDHRSDELPTKNKREAARSAAVALGAKCLNYYEDDLGIDPDTKLRNGMVRGAKPVQPPLKKRKTTGL